MITLLKIAAFIQNNIVLLLVIVILMLVLFRSNNTTSVINEDAYKTGTVIKRASDGKLYYQIKSIINNKKEFKLNDSLYNNFKTLDEKFRRLSNAIGISLNSKDSIVVVGYIDTVYINNQVELVEVENYDNGILALNRTKILEDSIAIYHYQYKPTIYAYITNFKVGKWRFKNIFKKRPKNTKVSIKSNDINMTIDSVKYITID